MTIAFIQLLCYATRHPGTNNINMSYRVIVSYQN
jgi:hypothetical protein